MQFTFNDSVLGILEKEFAFIKNSLPAKVVKYFPEKQCVSVIPLIRDQDMDGNIVELPQIDNVPVRFPAADINGKQALISLPVKPEDTVNLVFSMMSLDDWLNGDGKSVVTPRSKRKLDLNDCYAEVGACTFVSHLKPHPDNLEIKYAGNVFSLKPNGGVDLVSPLEVNITTPKANFSGDVNVAGTVTADVDCISAGVSGKSHTHKDVQTGSSNTGVPNG